MEEKKKSLTVLVCPQSFGRAAGAVSGCRETQHRGEILGELLQSRHIPHVDAVLEVWSHCHHGDLVVFARLPGEQLKQTNKEGGGCECETKRITHSSISSHTFVLTKLIIVSLSLSLSCSPEPLRGVIWH